ncbi:ferritin subunit [Ischnura elegans]|uniref:ferritin subunit n=1 Tax=Ischnura elegans TaxID=197161 RepID=UPI001ED87AC2|nr:ferritin subunit [Ischnura elegans]
MKTTFLLLLVIPFLGIVSSNDTLDPKSPCTHVAENIPDDWIKMADECVNAVRDQVQRELTAAMTYLAMGSHFSQYDVNRPGFAKYFFESASEEREHAIKFISYLLMRVASEKHVDHLIKNPKPKAVKLTDGVEALQEALKLEASVTDNIRSIAAICEKAPFNGTEFNDYHLVDYLSGDFLDEQYKGQRELAGMISTLKKMRHAQGTLGEYLFDKKLLNNELF